MPEITSIEMQKRGRRVTVFADGLPWCSVGQAIALQYGLRRGLPATAELLTQLEAADEQHRAHESALLLLSYRPRTEHELRERLSRKGAGEAAIAETITRLRASGLIDDSGFARAWVEGRSSGASALGRGRLRAELRRKGVAAGEVEAALASPEPDQGERQRALEVARKRAHSLRNLQYVDFRRRLSGFLQRRGFGYEEVGYAVREAWQALQAGEPEQSG